MSDRYRIEFELVGLPTPERNARRHWRTERKEIQGWRRAVGFAVLGREPPAPLKKARVVFTRHSAREPDPRNLEESFKSVEDGLVVAGILEDDRRENYDGGRPLTLWEKAPPRKGFITITVEEVEPDPPIRCDDPPPAGGSKTSTLKRGNDGSKEEEDDEEGGGDEGTAGFDFEGSGL